MKLRWLAALLLLLATIVPAQATVVLPMTLDDLAGSAAVAFEGTCVSNRVARDPNGMVVTYTTFEVRDVLKGSVGATHTIKQIGGEIDDGGPSYRAFGVPKFTPGQDYVVFLAGVSSAGFSSPMGLAQGRFVVQPDATGAKKVMNGRDFGELTAGIPASALPPGLVQKMRQSNRVTEMDLDAFKGLVRNRVTTLSALQGVQR